MFGFLLLILLIVILTPVIKVGWQIWSNMRRMRRFMSDPQGFMRDQQQRARKASGQQSYASGQQPRRRKKIDRDTGEYVRFEEVEVSREERTSAQSHTVSYTEESQITDIEWEDIK